MTRFVLAGILASTDASSLHAQATRPVGNGPSAYALLDRLTRLPGQVMVLQTSSHNKTGANGDENWPLYVDEHGDHVIFDAAGPGCIRSMWGTHFTEDACLKFYFDGEAAPRYRIRQIEFYQGKHPHFPSPLVSYERRGHYGERPFAGNCFVPVPFARSLKISVEGESRFFHVIWEKHPFGTPIETFSGKENRAALLDAFENLGRDPVDDTGLTTVAVDAGRVAPGQTVTLLDRRAEPGIVRRVAIEGPDSETFMRETEIRMRWEDHRLADVRAPIGFFFGSAVRAEEVRSLPLRVEKLPGSRVRLSCYFPMPFRKRARIDWVNNSSATLGPIRTRVTVGPNGLSPDQGPHFTALFRDGWTTYGRDWLLYETSGTGWFVGAVQSMRLEHYCEGDEHFSIDDAVSPQFNGTGSEDYYLACFWPNPPYASPFACGVGDIHAEAGGDLRRAYALPCCYARFHLEAPIPFHRRIDARIQHGGLSHIRSDYRSLAFGYVRRRPALVQTDYLDVGRAASETMHAYRAPKSERTGVVVARPEGSDRAVRRSACGRRHPGGEITFRVAIDPNNAGVRLRRRLDQGSPRQSAAVHVDGKYAGQWTHGDHNPHLRWYDSDLDIHPKFTRGKEFLEVKLVVDTTGGRGPFTDFSYTVYCFEEAGSPDATSGEGEQNRKR